MRPQTRRSSTVPEQKLAFASTSQLRGGVGNKLPAPVRWACVHLSGTHHNDKRDKKNNFAIKAVHVCEFSVLFLQVGGAQKPSCLPLRSISCTFDSSAGVRTRGIAQIKSIHVLRQRLTPFHSSGSLMLPFRTCVPFQRAVCGEGGVGAKSPPSPRTTEQTSPQVISNTLEM